MFAHGSSLWRRCLFSTSDRFVAMTSRVAHSERLLRGLIRSTDPQSDMRGTRTERARGRASASICVRAHCAFVPGILSTWLLAFCAGARGAQRDTRIVTACSLTAVYRYVGGCCAYISCRSALRAPRTAFSGDKESARHQARGVCTLMRGIGRRPSTRHDSSATNSASMFFAHMPGTAW